MVMRARWQDELHPDERRWAGAEAPSPAARSLPPAPPVLALQDVPPALAEPVQLVAEILGWQVRWSAPGLRVPAHLWLALMPGASHETATASPGLLAWSPDNNLNELISRAEASVLEQPICIHRLEQLLQAVGHAATCAWTGCNQVEGPVLRGGPTVEWGRVDDEDCHAGYG